MGKTWCRLLLCGAAMAVAAPAFAQVAPEATDSALGMFDRSRNASVGERPHPGYDPQPLPLGAFTGLPRIDAQAEFNDNIYSQNARKRSDTIFAVTPDFSLSSHWSRHALNLFARAPMRFYSRTSAENTTDVQGGGSGRIDLSTAGSVIAGGDYGMFHEPRSSPSAASTASKPVAYNSGNIFLAVQQDFNRVRLSGRVDYNDLDYKNATDLRGARVLQDDRDHSTTTVGGKVQYALTPAIALFGATAYNEHKYRLLPPIAAQNRNSKGSEVNGGADFDLTSLVRGLVQVGYMDQSYAGRFGHVKGFTGLARLEWFVTDLTTVTLTGSRNIQDASAVGSPAYISEQTALQADHELLRNLVLTGRVSYETDKYKVISRSDTVTNAVLAGKYYMNRLFAFNLSYNYAKLASSGANAGSRYVDNKILLGTTLSF